MKASLRGLLAVAAGIVCGMPANLLANALNLVPAAEQSAHFEAVASRLDLGGSSFSYVDLEGMLEPIGPAINNLIDLARESDPNFKTPFPIDADAILQALGLYDIAAAGQSVRRESDGFYRTRTYCHIPSGPSPLFRLLAGPAEPLGALAFAPQETDLFMTGVLRLQEVPEVADAVMTALLGAAGKAMVAGMLQQPLQVIPGTYADLAAHGDIRLTLVGKAGSRMAVPLPEDETGAGEEDPQPESAAPRMLEMARPEVVLVVENLGWLVDSLLEKKMIPAEALLEKDGMLFLVPPQKQEDPFDLTPAVVYQKETGVLAVTTIQSMAVAVLARPNGLRQQDSFSAVARGFPEKGTALAYVSPHCAQELQFVLEQVGREKPEVAAALGLYENILPMLHPSVAERGMAGMTVLEETGLYWEHRSPVLTWSRGPGTETALFTGMMAAMAIPAFEKVRANSQEKAILNNLRQLASAADMYMLSTGKQSCSFADLVGPEPEKFVREVKPVAGESYEDLVFEAGMTEISVVDAKGRVHIYQF